MVSCILWGILWSKYTYTSSINNLKSYFYGPYSFQCFQKGSTYFPCFWLFLSTEQHTDSTAAFWVLAVPRDCGATNPIGGWWWHWSQQSGNTRERQRLYIQSEKIQSEKGSQIWDDPGEKEKLEETLHILLSTEMSGSQTINHLGMSTSRLHLKHPCFLTHARKVLWKFSQERLY